MKKQELISYFNELAETRDWWKKRNWYYHQTVKNLCKFIIPPGSSVVEIYQQN